MKYDRLLNGAAHSILILVAIATVLHATATRAVADFSGGTSYSWTYSKTDDDPHIPPINLSGSGDNHSPPNSIPLSGGLPSGFTQPEGATYTGNAYVSPALIGCNAMVVAEAVDADAAYSGTVTIQASWQDTIYVLPKNVLNIYTVGSFYETGGSLQGRGDNHTNSSASVSILNKVANGFTFTTSYNDQTPLNAGGSYFENYGFFTSAGANSVQSLSGQPLKTTMTLTVTAHAAVDGHGATAYGDSDFLHTAKVVGFMAFDINKNPISADLLTISSDSGYNYPLLSGPPTPAGHGDYDGNGAVDAADYDVWRANFGKTAFYGLGADGNGNGVIDTADYAIWRDHLTTGNATSFPPQGVPEPGSALLFCLGLLGIRRRTRK